MSMPSPARERTTNWSRRTASLKKRGSLLIWLDKAMTWLVPHDTRRCHTAIIDRQGTAIIPIRKNGRPWKVDCPAAITRSQILRGTRHYGRALCKRGTGCHARRRIEAKMRGLNAVAERIAASDPDRQPAEIQIRIALMNRFSAFGTAEIIRLA